LKGKDYGYGPKYKISEKWKFMIDAPFKISDKCCNFLKKKPFIKYEKENDCFPIIGIMASDSENRRLSYIQQGCNAFNLKRPTSRPMMFWNNKDIWEYIKKYNLKYCSIYDTGINHTGCIFCAFGAHRNSTNRFQLMKISHPNLYKYCIEKLGYNKVLDFMKIKY
jgi:3'-phosphoadenosine 5'-phosphosulfate sulfotransferase (PAPS reductase)/FAD synthetase